MRKTNEKCPECGAPLYLRSEGVGRGQRITNLECHAAGCEWRDLAELEGEDD